MSIYFSIFGSNVVNLHWIMKNLLLILLFSLGSLAISAQTACTLANYGAAAILNVNEYPYFSPGSGITVSATWPGVSTLSNFSYVCNGQIFDTEAPAWWINNAAQVVTVTFSAPVTAFSVTVNGTNSAEEFYFGANAGTITLSDYCATGWTLINAGTGLRYNNAATTSSLITINNNPGATVFTFTHSGTGSGSRYAVLDCIVPAGPLPITLLNFDAKCETDNVSIMWSTESEINNDYFTVERSENGSDFEPIAEINGAGNSNQLISYAWSDDAPKKNATYYRLKQTDFNGEYSYSKTISKECVFSGNVSIYPNPAQDILTIESEGVIVDKIYVQDVTGNIVKTVIANTNTIDISELANGIYFIKLMDSENNITKKFVKQ